MAQLWSRQREQRPARLCGAVPGPAREVQHLVEQRVLARAASGRLYQSLKP